MHLEHHQCLFWKESRVEDDAGVCVRAVCVRWRDDDDGVVGAVGVFKRFFSAWCRFDCSLVRKRSTSY